MISYFTCVFGMKTAVLSKTTENKNCLHGGEGEGEDEDEDEDGDEQ